MLPLDIRGEKDGNNQFPKIAQGLHNNQCLVRLFLSFLFC